MATDKYLSVSALTKYLKYKFDSDEHLKCVFLKGEISNFKSHTSGHLYFSVKDEKSAQMLGGLNYINSDLTSQDKFFDWIKSRNNIFAYSEIYMGGEFEANVISKSFIGLFYKIELEYKGIRFYTLWPSCLEISNSVKFGFYN